MSDDLDRWADDGGPVMNSKPKKEKAMTAHKKTEHKTEHYQPSYVEPEREPGHTQAAADAGRAESQMQDIKAEREAVSHTTAPVKTPVIMASPPPVSPVKIVSERDKVIEECAKVAETAFASQHGYGGPIARAIRALKDRP